MPCKVVFSFGVTDHTNFIESDEFAYFNWCNRMGNFRNKTDCSRVVYVATRVWMEGEEGDSGPCVSFFRAHGCVSMAGLLDILYFCH